MAAELTWSSIQDRIVAEMLMRDQMTLPKAEVVSAMVASLPQIRLFVTHLPDLALIWRTREQRERE